MIKVENIDVYGFEHAVRAMRNPMSSWDKSDSYVRQADGDGIEISKYDEIGSNDLNLMRRLYRAGTEHRKYLRQIMVWMDIAAPLYWISEFDTYKVGVTRNSCSFMHKGVSKPFEITDFSVHDERVYEILSPIKKKEYPLRYDYETDEYKIHVGFNGRKYRVYKNGRVIAEEFEYTDTMGRHRILPEKECKPSQTRSGYYELNIGGVSKEKWMLHRLIATVWIDNPDNQYTVNHIDGDKGNNCVENLEWCSLKDNIKKGFDSGLYDNGTSLHARYQKWKNGHTVVSPHVKTQIINDHVQNGMTCKSLAEKYDITVSQANNLTSINPATETELFMLCYTWENVINTLNDLRSLYLETKDENIFQQIRCLLPCGYNQRFTVSMNYENVVTMIKQRSGHRLKEWNDFVKVLRDLPYVKEIMDTENAAE